MSRSNFVIKRLLLLVPILFGVVTIVFAIVQLSPGNPAQVIAGRYATESTVNEIERQLGLNKPLWEQYVNFLIDVSTFDFGTSYKVLPDMTVAEILKTRFPVTIELAVYGQLAGIIFGVPIGLIGSIKQDTITDHLTRIGALSGISIPIYWSGPLLILLFSQYLHLLPTSGRIGSQYSIQPITGLITLDTFIRGIQQTVASGLAVSNFSPFISAVQHMILPAGVIGIYSMALISRMMRSSMLEVIRQDYMRTARAKGQGRKITIMKHGFRNALIPVITVIGIQFGSLLGGAVLTETIFGIGGIGSLLVEAIETSDYPVVQGTVLSFAIVFSLITLVVDLTYAYLDPRIQQ